MHDRNVSSATSAECLLRRLPLELGRKSVLSLIAGAALALSASACGGDQKHAEGPAEQAGEAADEAAEDTKDAAEDTADEAGDAAEKAGDKVEDATDDAK
jgi:uncharacterized protein YjbJ (UPF0337 family)